MCQKKPGPRCYSHLSKESKRLSKEIKANKEELATLKPERNRLEALSDNTRDHKERHRYNSEYADVMWRMMDLEDDITKAETKKKDVKARIRGTRTGQQRMRKQLEKMRAEGVDEAKIESFAKEMKETKRAHKRSLKYAQWAARVESGEVPGRFVPSDGTGRQADVAYSGDPLYSATPREINAMSREDLRTAASGRYGEKAMTGITKMRVLDRLAHLDY